MGSVTTWRTFQYALDYFYYFMPMSCGTTLPDEEIFAAAEGHAQDDYFVWVSTGTADFAYGYDENRVDRMRNSPYFTEGENFLYLLKDDPAYTHGPMAEEEYTYNGMMWFWTSNDSAPKGKEEMQTYKPVTAISAGKPKKQGISTGFGHCITGFDTIFTPFSRKLTDEKP